MLVKNMRVRLGISVVCIVLFLIAVLSVVLVTAERKEVIETYTKIEDGAMLTYMTCMEYTNDLRYLYEIGNEDTYKKAQSNIKMSAELTKKYFTTANYNGAEHDYSCKIVEVKGAVPDETETLTADSTFKYLVTLQQTDNLTNVSKVIFVVVTYTDGVLVDLYQL